MIHDLMKIILQTLVLGRIHDLEKEKEKAFVR